MPVTGFSDRMGYGRLREKVMLSPGNSIHLKLDDYSLTFAFLP